MKSNFIAPMEINWLSTLESMSSLSEEGIIVNIVAIGASARNSISMSYTMRVQTVNAPVKIILFAEYARCNLETNPYLKKMAHCSILFINVLSSHMSQAWAAAGHVTCHIQNKMVERKIRVENACWA